VWQMLFTLLVFSLALLLFNLIPLPPLDGSHVLENLLPRDAAMAYARLRPFAPLLLVALVLTHAVNGLLGWALTGMLRLLLPG
jgi:Zn-dependent protease